MTADRRTHPRVPVFVDGRWQSQATAGLCRAANLSLGGCFAQTLSTPSLDEPILVTLFFTGRGAMPLRGHVVRVAPGAGFAVRFDELGPEARYRLGEEINQIRRRAGAPPSAVIQ